MAAAMKSLFPIVLLLIGESVYIVAELLIADLAKQSHFPYRAFAALFGVTIISGLLIILGYYFGYKSFRNIWVVSALSIGSVLIAEPTVSWIIFREMPTRGAAVGLGLGILGILSATLF